jgi:carboxyl-terminal processing protease
MKRIKWLQLFLIIGIAFAGGYFFGVNKVNVEWKNYKPLLSVVSKEPPAGLTNVDFTPFWNVWQKLYVGYYDKTKLDPQEMLNGAISGMVQSVGDPFTVYLPPANNSDFKQGLAGQFSGIGAELGVKDKNIIVISPLDGSPAQRSGIRAGDIISAVDGQSTAGWSIGQAVEKIRGQKGTVVTLSIVHKDSTKKEDIKITRDIITVKSVEMKMRQASCEGNSCKLVQESEKCEGNCVTYAYIRLSQFGDNTNQEWVNMISDFAPQINSDKVRGVVFDLRNNPGGYLSDATFIASEFLPKGKVVVYEEQGNLDRRAMYVERDGLLTDVEVIVLVNKGSASASEIVAAALKENGRTRIIGETTFGKGTIQTAEDLGNGAGLHVTIAKWLTPLGNWINEKGITPDVSVEFNEDKPDVDNQLEKAVFELVK